MKLTKARLHKVLKTHCQTRKKMKPNKKLLTHTNTVCNRVRQFNLRNNTIKNHF